MGGGAEAGEEEALKEALTTERDKQEDERVREQAQRELEKTAADKKYERLKNHLLEVEETTMDTVGWIANNDTKMLDRIKLRHLLNKVQEMLAIAAGLTQDAFGASLAWREALGSSDDLSARLTRACDLLHNSGVELDPPTHTFISCTEGMSLVVEARSLIRQRGDKVAHPITITRQHFDGPILCNPYVSDTPGLEALVDFVCART